MKTSTRAAKSISAKSTALKSATVSMPTRSSFKLHLAAGALALAMLAIPHMGHAQGIIGGAEEGSREEGSRASRRSLNR